MSEKWVEFEAKTLFGEDRKYNIKLMDCETGLKAWQDHFAVLMEAMPEMQQSFEDDSLDVVTMGYTIAKLFSWDLLKEIAGLLLPGAEVTIAGDKHKLNDKGLGDPFSGNPAELYNALYHAAMQNYKPLMSQIKLEKSEEKKKALTA